LPVPSTQFIINTETCRKSRRISFPTSISSIGFGFTRGICLAKTCERVYADENLPGYGRDKTKINLDSVNVRLLIIMGARRQRGQTMFMRDTETSRSRKYGFVRLFRPFLFFIFPRRRDKYAL